MALRERIERTSGVNPSGNGQNRIKCRKSMEMNGSREESKLRHLSQRAFLAESGSSGALAFGKRLSLAAGAQPRLGVGFPCGPHRAERAYLGIKASNAVRPERPTIASGFLALETGQRDGAPTPWTSDQTPTSL